MHFNNVKITLLLLCIFTLLAGCTEPAGPITSIENVRQQMQDLDRGRYVIVVMGCNDCHTPDYLIRRGNIPEEDWLVGSSLGFKGPNGTSYPINLRLLVNNLSEDGWLTVAKQMRRETPMADVMLPQTTDEDLRAIYKYLKYLGPKGVEAPASLPAGATPDTQYILSPGPH